jgi:two-component system phosphate regulon response regulator PhoB
MAMKKILIVEDEPDILDVITLTLEMGSYELLKATDGTKALTLAVEENPELIILDVMLPGELDGIDVCKRLRSTEVTKNSHIMILSARGMEKDVQAGIEAGCDEYIVKPFSPLELIQRIKTILG